MFFKDSLKSRSGFTLVEIVVVLALVGLATYGVLSLTGNLASSSKRAEGVVAKTLFTSSLSTYLYSPTGCEDLKVSNGGGAFFTNTPQDIILTKWKYQGYPIIRGGVDVSGAKYTNFVHFDIELLRAYLEPLGSAAKVTSLLPDGTKEELLKSTLVVQSTIKVGARPYHHVYNVPVLLGSAGDVKFCGDEMVLAETCATTKGIYNPATRSCDLSEGCMIRDTYTTLTCAAPPCDTRLGAPKMNKYTGGFSCPVNSTAIKTHGTSWYSTASCGKKCTTPVLNQMEWFSCMACP